MGTSLGERRTQGAGKTLAEKAQACGYNYLTAKSDLAGVANADQKRPLLGLFSSGNSRGGCPLVATPGGVVGPAQNARRSTRSASPAQTDLFFTIRNALGIGRR